MHISEGVLSLYPLTIGAVGAVAGIAAGLKKMEIDEVPRVGIVSAALFVSSLIHINVGPASVHLLLNGIGGLLLGIKLFPAYLVALFLQVLLFQFGGLAVLGVNICTMAIPGLVGGYLGRCIIISGKPPWLGGAVAGGIGVVLAALFTALALAFSGEVLLITAKLVLLAHIPVVILESLIGAFIASFIYKMMPSLLGVDEK
ncbi:cobalt transporter CbiM [Acetomicrobium hydrogeniformans]|uniref:Cobalt transporter CbiM n=1 Tax=Acetomicrobium hydrogeniformans TaxID=649746 RepID=A0A7V6ZDV1_9BACT|nr:cobalt transporter CbiM [Acetomicrobium hydrogeniformans]HHZ04026.1 cobalt transporter CbiM [Acetomicrobium hydrogeniformans]